MSVLVRALLVSVAGVLVSYTARASPDSTGSGGREVSCHLTPNLTPMVSLEVSIRIPSTYSPLTASEAPHPLSAPSQCSIAGPRQAGFLV